MKVKTWLIPLAVVLCICAVFATVTRFDYSEIKPETIQNYSFRSSGLDSVLEESACEDFSDCVEAADFVIIGSYSGENSFTDEAIYSKIKVEKVLKGENLPEEITFIDTVYIYPPNSFMTMSNGRIPLKDGCQYLFLLKKAEYDPGRYLPAEIKDPYYPIFQSALGCYEITESQQDVYFNSDENYTLNTLQENTQVWVESQSELDLYNSFQKQVLKYINSSNSN